MAKKKFQRFNTLPHHHTPYDKAWDAIDRSAGLDACWPWRGRVCRGIGRFTFRALEYDPARVVYERMRTPMQFNDVLIHICKNKLCCNPAHMAHTARDGWFSEHRSEYHPRANKSKGILTNLEVEYLRVLASDGESNVDLAEKFGIAPETASKIIHGRTRADAGGPIRPARQRGREAWDKAGFEFRMRARPAKELAEELNVGINTFYRQMANYGKNGRRLVATIHKGSPESLAASRLPRPRPKEEDLRAGKGGGLEF